MRKKAPPKVPPLKFLLEASDNAVGNFELANLDEVANLRREMLAMFDRIVDVSAQAVLAAWLRTIDRNELRRQLLESPGTTLEVIMSEAKAEIRNSGRSKEEAEEYEEMPSPWLVRPKKYHTVEERRAAHSASTVRSQERRIADGKCEKCPEPLDRNSVRYCTKHLAWKREQDRKDREKKGVQIGTHGRQPGTLANLAMNREKRTRSLLLELGIKPTHAAVTLKAVKEALLNVMPDKAHAMTQAELGARCQAGALSYTTGQKAIKAFLAEKKIQRIGAGAVREPYRYFLTG